VDPHVLELGGRLLERIHDRYRLAVGEPDDQVGPRLDVVENGLRRTALRVQRGADLGGDRGDGDA
jgi:hypothetical protein